MHRFEFDGTMWYGFDKDKRAVAISQATLLDWAKKRGCYNEIYTSTVVMLPDGTRLVRGPRMLREAAQHGWDDIAQAISEEIEADVK